MISIYTGIPGSGKTYHAVSMILKYVSLGRRVYTNIRNINPIEISNYLDWPLSEHLLYILPEHDLKQFYLYVPENSLIVFDEYQNIFPAIDYKANTPAISFFTTHRHKGIDVILITQSTTLGDSRLTALCEEYHDFRKLSFLGASSKYRHACFMGATDAQQNHMYTKVHSYNKKIFNMYSSYVSSEIQEQTQKNTIFSNPKVIGFLVLILISFVFLIYQFTHTNFNILPSASSSSKNSSASNTQSKGSNNAQNPLDSSKIPRPFYVDWGDTVYISSP